MFPFWLPGIFLSKRKWYLIHEVRWFLMPLLFLPSKKIILKVCVSIAWAAITKHLKLGDFNSTILLILENWKYEIWVPGKLDFKSFKINIITICLLSLCSFLPISLIYPSLFSFKFMASFSIIVTMYLYISKYNLLNLYVYVFMTNYLSLNNHLVCPSLGKVSHSQLSSDVCTIVPCVEWRDGGLLLIQSGRSIGVILIQLLSGQSC